MGWDLACPDWEARIRAGRSLVPPLPLDDVAADRAVSIHPPRAAFRFLAGSAFSS